MNRPKTTLFMLVSVDGKISTGDTELLDVDQDYKKIPDLKKGLQQYYDLEKETDLFSLNSGRVLKKIGINQKIDEPKKLPVSFVVVDNEPHLTVHGVTYLAKKLHRLFVVTTNLSHPAFSIKQKYPNVEIILCKKKINFPQVFSQLRKKYGIKKITIQSGGMLNTIFVREGLVDRILLVMAPALIGGKNTSTLMDGESFHTLNDLNKIRTLKLVQAKPLKNSYLLLEYDIKN